MNNTHALSASELETIKQYLIDTSTQDVGPDDDDTQADTFEKRVRACTDLNGLTKMAHESSWDLEAWCHYLIRHTEGLAKCRDHVSAWGYMTAEWGVEPRLAECFDS